MHHLDILALTQPQFCKQAPLLQYSMQSKDPAMWCQWNDWKPLIQVTIEWVVHSFHSSSTAFAAHSIVAMNYIQVGTSKMHGWNHH